MPIPVIDIFAGPGGLGEGFSNVLDDQGERVFEIKLSIEKDEHAHKTLKLRSFFRQFPVGLAPDLYYEYIKANNLKKQNQILEELKVKYSEQWKDAEREAWLFELPFPLEKKKKNEKEYFIGYTPDQIEDRHNEIDQRIVTALPENEEFLLIGGPPCQAYSLVGRSRNQGISEGDHRVHLYKEYLRIIAKHQPAVFVMENVKGLLSANIGGTKVFDLIKQDLENPSAVFPEIESQRYKLFSFVKEPDGFDNNGFPIYSINRDFLIKTEKYGIPQRRHRVILLGIREDFNVARVTSLIGRDRETTLSQVIGALPKIRSGIGREIVGENERGKNIYRRIANLQKNWEHAIYYYKSKLDSDLQDIADNLLQNDDQGSNYKRYELDEANNPIYDSWYKDERLQGVLNHEGRTHLKEDLGRYLFSSLYLKKHRKFPRLKDYPDWLLPRHKNAKGDKFADRFRTQQPEEAATTITSHISKDGHYFIHYDPAQCRSLTVREAARIQTFPDNYYFCGSRTHQYHQVGNAVPPYLAKQLGEIVHRILNNAL